MAYTTFIDVDSYFSWIGFIAEVVLFDPCLTFARSKLQIELSCSGRCASTCTTPVVELLLFMRLDTGHNKLCIIYTTEY